MRNASLLTGSGIRFVFVSPAKATLNFFLDFGIKSMACRAVVLQQVLQALQFCGACIEGLSKVVRSPNKPEPGGRFGSSWNRDLGC